MINEIVLRRKGHIYIEEHVSYEKSPVPQKKRLRVLTMMRNIEQLGFTFSQELYEQLACMKESVQNACYLELVRLLKEQVGADHVYTPMYPGFPQEVMEKEEGELYLNAMMHYWSNGILYPFSQKQERLPFFDGKKRTVLSLGTREELVEIFRDLVSANGSLSEQDLTDIRWYFAHLPEAAQELPETIPYKENAAYICVCYLDCSPLAELSVLHRYLQTGTDVLRLAVVLSGGHQSLKKKTRFKSFSRKERRMLMGLLADASGLLEAMHQRPEVWKRLGERLHPGEYGAEQYKNVRSAYAKLRAGKPMEHYRGKVEAALKRREMAEVLRLLKERPAELARRLDLLLRLDASMPETEPQNWWNSRLLRMQRQKEVLETFAAVSGQVSTPVLLQVRTHFQYRNHQNFRYYYPKGKLAQARRIENAAEQVEEEVCCQVVSLCEQALMQRFAALAPMGKVWLSETLKDYMVPFAQRSASKAARTLVRGSRLPVKEQTKAVRGFVWWTNTEKGGRVDLDLSAGIFDEHWNYLEHVSYTNLKAPRFRACHSGDIVNGGPADGDGVCEFLDIDLPGVLENKGRYVVYEVYSYTEQLFSALPHVSFGYMEREDVQSGEIFEPAAVGQRMDLVQETVISIPMILDCLTRQMIWCDAGMGLSGCRTRLGGNNLESNLTGVALACDTMVHMHRTSLYDLLKMHVEARGEQCGTKEEADLIFDVEEGITPFDTEVILAEYMQ